MTEWLGKQFSEGMLFRRLYIAFMGAYIAMVSYYSFKYLFIATSNGVSSIDIVANLAAVFKLSSNASGCAPALARSALISSNMYCS